MQQTKETITDRRQLSTQKPVSYTHLDVYKRQSVCWLLNGRRPGMPQAEFFYSMSMLFMQRSSRLAHHAFLFTESDSVFQDLLHSSALKPGRILSLFELS